MKRLLTFILVAFMALSIPAYSQGQPIEDMVQNTAKFKITKSVHKNGLVVINTMPAVVVFNTGEINKFYHISLSYDTLLGNGQYVLNVEYDTERPCDISPEDPLRFIFNDDYNNFVYLDSDEIGGKSTYGPTGYSVLGTYIITPEELDKFVKFKVTKIYYKLSDYSFECDVAEDRFSSTISKQYELIKKELKKYGIGGR